MNQSDVRPLRLLVIDDEALQLRSLCALLCREGHTVSGYLDPLAALADAALAQFDLMLVDLVMPGMNGIEAIRAVQDIAPGLGCVVITAEATIAGSVEAMQAGALDFIPKPFDMASLLPALYRAQRMQRLRRAKSEAEASERSMVSALADSNRRLLQAHSDAAHASAAKSQFIGRLSRELRTPLNSIIGFAHILKSRSLPGTPAQRSDFAGHILDSAKYLLGLVNEVRDLSHIEAGKLPLQFEAVPLQGLVAECCAMLLPLAAAREVRLQNRVPSGLAMAADRMRLKQVVLNLLSNGIKYNRGGGEVGGAAELMPRALVALAVHDTGQGMAPEQVALLFPPFERWGRTGGKLDGCGLGLVIAQQLCTLLRGSIEVDSAPGEGSPFTVTLPAALPEGG